ncbi:hypothetical protein RhiirA1_446008 [Rhizophagus irregularis]|uniref:Uncharacterized protein n=1 Tax=Rhizophagus irregularis TaxID=588596 RepID=A0A2N0R3N9_9GLOM|nr:hypothetical protein RhiirA1_446008 [Rhizophagus irregularis]
MDSKSGTAYEFECEFLEIKAMKNMRKCYKVKMCFHSAEELNSSHDSVNFETNTYKNIYNIYEHSIEKYIINLAKVVQQNILSDVMDRKKENRFSNNTITDSGLIIHKPCQGIYAHPPPPPVKIPINLVKDLQSIINNENLSNFTARKFLTNLSYFEIDIAFKRIQGEIKEWENIRQKSEIPTEIKKIMYAIPHLETKAEVLNVLEQIKLTQNKQAIDWVNDKSKKWGLAEKRKSNTTKKTNRMTKKQKTTILNIDNSYDSRNALEESNLPNGQQQKIILEFEKERNKILKERLSLKKELLELGEN